MVTTTCKDRVSNCYVLNIYYANYCFRYYLQITATKGIRGEVGDIGIDDISLSPECVGLGEY